MKMKCHLFMADHTFEQILPNVGSDSIWDSNSVNRVPAKYFFPISRFSSFFLSMLLRFLVKLLPFPIKWQLKAEIHNVASENQFLHLFLSNHMFWLFLGHLVVNGDQKSPIPPKMSLRSCKSAQKHTSSL